MNQYKHSSSNVEFVLARIIIYIIVNVSSCDRHKICTTIARATYDDEGIVHIRGTVAQRSCSVIEQSYNVLANVHSQHNRTTCIDVKRRSNLSCDRESILNMVKYFYDGFTTLFLSYEVEKPCDDCHYCLTIFPDFFYFLSCTCPTGLRRMWKGLKIDDYINTDCPTKSH